MSTVNHHQYPIHQFNKNLKKRYDTCVGEVDKQIVVLEYFFTSTFTNTYFQFPQCVKEF